MKRKISKLSCVYVILIILLVLSLILLLFAKYNTTNTESVETVVDDVIDEVDSDIESYNFVYSSRSIYYEDIDKNTDLLVMNYITADEINKVIRYWDSFSEEEIPFVDKGQIFIEASRESGLDPIYILAHAAVESAWGTSEIGNNKYNYFGIAAFNHDPDQAYIMGESMEDGIINGAKWIREHYYDNGQRNLYSMRYNNGVNEYCTSDTWVNSILRIIQTSYEILQLS